MQLVLIAHRSSTTFQIGHIAPVVAHDERTFELPRIPRIDPEISGKLHRATHAFGDIDKGTVAEHCGIQRREIVVTVRDHRT